MKFVDRPEEDYALQLTPLIDVVFLLLIFFMVSTSFIDFSRQLDIELPESSVGVALEKTKLFEIEMTAEKKIFFNGEPSALDEIADRIERNADPLIKRAAIIRADRRLEYGLIVSALEILKNAEINDIGLALTPNAP